MGLNATLKNAVEGMFTTLAELTITVTYVRVTAAAYDPSTDTVATTTTSYPNVRALRARMTEDDQEWLVPNSKMMKLLIPYNSLPFSPGDDDYVTVSGTRWNVYKSKAIPGDSLHTLFLREP